MKRRRPYLITNRLTDVLALIQVLALDEHAHRSEDGLTSELQGKPASANNWSDIANEHPEFFRFRSTGGEHKTSLVSRHVTPKNSKGIRELPIEFTHKLLETAIELHDRQLNRSERWKYWLPVYGVLITGFFSLIVAFYKPNDERSNLPSTKIENSRDYSEGPYLSPDSVYQLNAFVNRSNSKKANFALVELSIVDTKTLKENILTTRIGDAMKWAIGWYGKNLIVAQSSDIGTRAWQVLNGQLQDTEVTSEMQIFAKKLKRIKYELE